MLGRTPELDKFKNLLRVRHHVVALLFDKLKAYNHYYTDVVLDAEALNELPEDGIPEELLMTAKIAEQSPGNAGYAPTDEAQDPHVLREGDLSEEPFVLEAVGLVDVEGTTVPLEEQICAAANSLASSAGDWVSRVPCSTTPSSEYKNPSLGHKAFPLEFCFGIGAFDMPRTNNRLSFDDHQRVLLNYPDDRFELHPFYIFYAFNVQMRKKLCANAGCIQTRCYITRKTTL